MHFILYFKNSNDVKIILIIKVSKTASETFEKVKTTSVWGDKVTSHLIAAQQFWLTFEVALVHVHHFGLCRKQKAKIDEAQ